MAIGAAAGAVVGAGVFATFTGLGILLSSRLGVSPLVPIVILALAGAYAGWLLGVIVFSAVRGGGSEKERT